MSAPWVNAVACTDRASIAASVPVWTRTSLRSAPIASPIERAIWSGNRAPRPRRRARAAAISGPAAVPPRTSAGSAWRKTAACACARPASGTVSLVAEDVSLRGASADLGRPACRSWARSATCVGMVISRYLAVAWSRCVITVRGRTYTDKTKLGRHSGDQHARPARRADEVVADVEQVEPHTDEQDAGHEERVHPHADRDERHLQERAQRDAPTTSLNEGGADQDGGQTDQQPGLEAAQPGRRLRDGPWNEKHGERLEPQYRGERAAGGPVDPDAALGDLLLGGLGLGLGGL